MTDTTSTAHYQRVAEQFSFQKISSFLKTNYWGGQGRPCCPASDTHAHGIKGLL